MSDSIRGDERQEEFDTSRKTDHTSSHEPSASPTVLITGASGNLGAKLRLHLQGRYQLSLLDCDPRGDEAILQADLSVWDMRWVELFRGVDVVVHLAADPTAQ
ncbi:MAG TPA: hypothetical protein VFU48_10690, partial [Nitrospira sp.]|nr:hypothetical protein [Nitrospira sp.]